MLNDPDWLEDRRATGKRLPYIMRCAEAASGFPNA